MLLFHEGIELGWVKKIGEREVTLQVGNEEVTVQVSEEKELHDFVSHPQNDVMIPINRKTQQICELTDLESWNEGTMDELIEVSQRGAEQDE
ncbi:hypothetical protein [Bacillus sp. CDB3]|uniref:hypothetical protein n=1 Tax=Bacillus sp. CDB3 TaxID=360310 RepID=UPI0009D84DF3|nr:hypothetical protein [Bacillus sp. CDB3]OQR53280.1 hypothetical protein CDB3_31020 [Bacillus sp. CDB3]